jgi:hypothetical protein
MNALMDAHISMNAFIHGAVLFPLSNALMEKHCPVNDAEDPRLDG